MFSTRSAEGTSPRFPHPTSHFSLPLILFAMESKDIISIVALVLSVIALLYAVFFKDALGIGDRRGKNEKKLNDGYVNIEESMAHFRSRSAAVLRFDRDHPDDETHRVKLRTFWREFCNGTEDWVTFSLLPRTVSAQFWVTGFWLPRIRQYLQMEYIDIAKFHSATRPVLTAFQARQEYIRPSQFTRLELIYERLPDMLNSRYLGRLRSSWIVDCGRC